MSTPHKPGAVSPVRYVVALLAVVAYALPLYIAILNTFKTNTQIINDPAALPAPWTLDNVTRVLFDPNSDLLATLGRTVFIVVSSVVLILIVGSMLGYYVGRYENRMVRIIMLSLLLGLAVPSQVLLIPLTQTLRSVGLLNSYAGLILCNVGFFVPFTVLIFSRFVRSIPRELDEAASIDGAGPLRTFFTVIFPLMRPAASSVAIFASVGIWNDFVNPLILLGPATGTTIMAGLYRTLGQYTSDFGTTFAYMFLASLPILVLFLILQRNFINGLTAGAAKG